jgi:hypothetical protein
VGKHIRLRSCQLALTTEFTEENGKPRVNRWRNTRKGNHLVAGVGVGTMRNRRNNWISRSWRLLRHTLSKIKTPCTFMPFSCGTKDSDYSILIHLNLTIKLHFSRGVGCNACNARIQRVLHRILYSNVARLICITYAWHSHSIRIAFAQHLHDIRAS